MYKLFKGERDQMFAPLKCKWCKKEVEGFRDLYSIREYTRSLLCQVCQDSIYGKTEDKHPARSYHRIDTGREKGERS